MITDTKKPITPETLRNAARLLEEAAQIRSLEVRDPSSLNWNVECRGIDKLDSSNRDRVIRAFRAALEPVAKELEQEARTLIQEPDQVVYRETGTLRESA
jgi:hypothetical protein